MKNMDRKTDEQVGEVDHQNKGPVQKHVLMTHPESVPEESRRAPRGSASGFQSVPLVQNSVVPIQPFPPVRALPFPAFSFPKRHPHISTPIIH